VVSVRSVKRVEYFRKFCKSELPIVVQVELLENEATLGPRCINPHPIQPIFKVVSVEIAEGVLVEEAEGVEEVEVAL